jgi:hypothetical protein
MTGGAHTTGDHRGDRDEPDHRHQAHDPDRAGALIRQPALTMTPKA